MTKTSPDNKLDTSLVRVLSISSSVNDEIVQNDLRDGQDTLSIDICEPKEEDQSLSQHSATKECTRKDATSKPQTHERSLRQLSRVAIFPVSQDAMNENQQSNDSPEFLLDFEKRKHEEKEFERNEKFKMIICDGQLESSLVKLLFLTFGITFFGYLNSISLTLIPYHNLVQSPEYWYEILLPALHMGGLISVYRCIVIGSYMNMEDLLVTRNLTLMSFAGIATQMVLVLASYFLWTSILDKQYPIPFLGFLLTYASCIYNPFYAWFLIPKKLRLIKKLKKKIGFAMITIAIRIFFVAFDTIIIERIKKASDQYQPIVALALPIMREAHIRLSGLAIKKSCNGDEKFSIIILNYAINTYYVMNLCMILGSVATNSTSIVLLGVDYATNVWLAVKLAWTNKRGTSTTQEQIDLLQDLALGELVEFQGPVAYMLLFVSLANGPNFQLFGNMGNSYWAYTAIEDINKTLRNIMIFFVVDFSSTVITALILWYSCNIKLWKALQDIQNEFGKYFSLILGYVLFTVCFNTSLKIMEFATNKMNH